MTTRATKAALETAASLTGFIWSDEILRAALRHIARQAGEFEMHSSLQRQGEIIEDIRRTAEGALRETHDLEYIGGPDGHQQSTASAEHCESNQSDKARASDS